MIKNIKKLKENNLKCYLIVVTIITIFNTSISYAYIFNNSYTFGSNNKSETKESKNIKDPYYEKLIEKFKSDKKYIDKVYKKYSAYVIDLSEKYGIEPIIAMANMKSELDFAVLATNPDLFMDLYNSLNNIKNREKRAGYALKLANAFFNADLNDNNWKANFTNLIKDCSQTYLDNSKIGNSRLEKAKSKIKKIVPDNYLNDLRKNEKKYSLFLSELAKQKDKIIEKIIEYPNSISFLLNTGKDGLELLNQYPKTVIVLSFILTSEEQKKLIENCNKHHKFKLLEAVKHCGIESYFTIMRCPNFYEKLVSKLEGEMSRRYVLAYAYLVKQEELKKDGFDNINFIISKLEENSDELDNVVGNLSELMFSYSDSKFGCFAPFYDVFCLKFIYTYGKKDIYGKKAKRVIQKYGNMLNIASLFMKDWNGENQELEPLLEAVERFGIYAIRAILELKDNKEFQKNILIDCKNEKRKSDLLMLLYYDIKYMNKSITCQYKNGLNSSAIDGILDEYSVEDFTGRPKGKDTSIVEFVPGYDLFNTTYEYLIYGKSPTALDIFWSAFDVVDFVPFLAAAGTVGETILEKGLKEGSREIYQNAFKNVGDSLKSFTKKTTIKDLTPDLIKKTPNLIKDVNKCNFLDTWAEITIKKIPDFADIKKYCFYIKELSLKAKIGVKNFVLSELNDIKKLYSGPNRLKHSVNKLMYGTLDDFVKEPTMFYLGVTSLEDYLETRKE